MTKRAKKVVNVTQVCTFCNKSRDEVRMLISAPQKPNPIAYICEMCVSVCVHIMAGKIVMP